jgi:hypothetical protein
MDSDQDLDVDVDMYLNLDQDMVLDMYKDPVQDLDFNPALVLVAIVMSGLLSGRAFMVPIIPGGGVFVKGLSAACRPFFP